MLILIKHMADWEWIFQWKQKKINKDNIRENKNQVDHAYKVGYKFILNNHAVYKYETPFKGSFTITPCFTNGTVNLQYDPTKIRHNIHWIKPYKSDTNVEDINLKHLCDDVTIISPVIHFCIILNIGNTSQH